MTPNTNYYSIIKETTFEVPQDVIGQEAYLDMDIEDRAMIDTHIATVLTNWRRRATMRGNNPKGFGAGQAFSIVVFMAQMTDPNSDVIRRLLKL